MLIKRFFLLIVMLLFSLPLAAQDGATLFKTGQSADIILGANAVAAPRTAFNQPSRVMSDGTRLFVADPRNNRVLIWFDASAAGKTRADVVVGQPDLTSNGSGSGPDQLNWPVGVYSDGTRLFVADTYNDRVLIWNSIPSNNGQPADLVLGQPTLSGIDPDNDPASDIFWPWDVAWDGSWLYVVNSGEGFVSIWKSFPARNNQPADLVLGRESFESFGTFNQRASMLSPRSIAVDGKSIVVGDTSMRQLYIWNSRPKKNGAEADVVIHQPSFNGFFSGRLPRYNPGLYAMSLHKGSLVIAGDYVYIWDSLPETDLAAFDRWAELADVNSGIDIWGAALDGNRLLVAETNNNRIGIYDLDVDDTWRPDALLGARNRNDYIYSTRKGFNELGGVLSTGSRLYVGSYSKRGAVYQQVPTRDEQRFDTIISMMEWNEENRSSRLHDPIGSPTEAWSDGRRLLWADGRTGAIMLYDTPPTADNQLPDGYVINDYESFRRLPAEFSNFGLNHLEVHRRGMMATSTDGKRLYIWKGFPDLRRFSMPDVTIENKNRLGGIATDGKRLWVADYERGILYWDEIPTSDNARPSAIIKGAPEKFIQVVDLLLIGDSLLAADSGRHGIYMFNTAPEKKKARYDAVIGQDNLKSGIPGKSRDKLLQPAWLNFDGEYLWVAERVFSDRILGFRADVPEDAPSAPRRARGRGRSSNQINLRWKDTSTNESHFRLEYRTSGSSEWQLYAAPPYNTKKYQVEGLLPGTTYDFRLRSVNSFGASDPLIFSAATKQKANNAPEIPVPRMPFDRTGDFSIGTDGAFILFWGVEDPDVGDRMTFDIYFGTQPDPPLVAADHPSMVYSFRNVVLPEETTFYWRVVARDLQGAERDGGVWRFRTRSFPTPGNRLIITASEGGTTQLGEGIHTYSAAAGDADRLLALVIAVADEGYEFVRWQGDVPNSLQQDRTLLLPADRQRQITPVFQRVN